jgi:Vitamin K-dependent gamma-carboxylase
MFARWVRFWNTRERGESLALVRILVPLVLLWDLTQVWQLSLVRVLWAPVEEGGLGPASHDAPVIELYQWLGATLQTTHVLLALTVLSALSLALGVFSRTSALILLLAYAQLEKLSPDADRGIDTLLRNVLCILVFARAGSTLSLGARFRRGSFVSEELVPAWPRYLVIAQLVVLYFFAGLSKDSANWSLRGDYAALFYVLSEPHAARFELPRELLVRLYPLLQLGTISTVLWERAAILLPLLLWLRKTRAHGGLLRRWVNRLRLLELWVGTGVFFHLTLALLLSLGIFPWGCLALYPALLRPEALHHAVARLRAALSLRLVRLHAIATGTRG